MRGVAGHAVLADRAVTIFVLTDFLPQLFVTIEAKLTTVFEQVVFIVRSVWIMTADACSLFDLQVRAFGLVRDQTIVTAETDLLWCCR